MSDRSATRLLALLASIVVVSGCGTVATSRSTAAQPRPAPTTAAPTTPTPNNVMPGPISTDPGGVAAAIGEIVVPAGTRLVPAYVPPSMSAIVRRYPGGVKGEAYSVTYTDEVHTREITLSVNNGATPPPATSPTTARATSSSEASARCTPSSTRRPR
jgi:hypothetical protein